MSGAPTDKEVGRCLKAMKKGKASGEDRITAELLQYGGDRLKEDLYRIVTLPNSEGLVGQGGRFGSGF